MDKCFDLWLQAQQVLCELEALKAANAFQEQRGFAQAYGEDAFIRLADRLTQIQDSWRSYGQVAESADALDLKSSGSNSRAGSSPALATTRTVA